MAALSTVTVQRRVPLGNRFLVAGTAGVTTTLGHVASAKLNLATIDSIIGNTANVIGGYEILKNAQSTTVDANHGDLLLDGAGTTTHNFCVWGR